jgi:hypothetical protein
MHRQSLHLTSGILLNTITTCIAVLLAVIGASAQSPGSDPFDGTWRLSAARSQTMWQAQPQPKRPTAQPQSQELITMRIAGGAVDYRVDYGGGRTAAYKAAFNDAKWQDVRGEAEGNVTALTLVKINDRLHYWVTRTKDGQFAGVVQRSLAADGKSFTSIGLGPDGYVQYVRVFEKQ